MGFVATSAGSMVSTGAEAGFSCENSLATLEQSLFRDRVEFDFL